MNGRSGCAAVIFINPQSSGRRSTSTMTSTINKEVIVSNITKDLEQLITSDKTGQTKILFHFKKQISNPNRPNNDWWKWHDPSNYVRLPLSPFSVLFGFHQRWSIIEEALSQLKKFYENPVNSQNFGISETMRHTITKYGTGNINSEAISNFGVPKDPEITQILRNTLPQIANHALNLPRLLARPVPILRRGENQTVYFTRRLVASFIANAFFSTFPETRHNSKDFPYFHFLRLFHKPNDPQIGKLKAEKLKCIMNYFVQLDEAELDQVISVQRRSIKSSKVKWGRSTNPLCPVKIISSGGIEKSCGTLQVNFANKVPGGGVLNEGSVMEEIRFLMSPELIVTRMFVEPLEDDEVLVVTGTKLFNKYSGYSSTFKFEGSADAGADDGKIDNLGRTFTQIVSMDAVNFGSNKHVQYEPFYIKRELHKCFVGFAEGNCPVATGNWGCGVFNGDPELKFLLQWMACSEQKRNSMHYYTGGSFQFSANLPKMENLISNNAKLNNVGQLYGIVMEYNKTGGIKSLFRFIEDGIN